MFDKVRFAAANYPARLRELVLLVLTGAGAGGVAGRVDDPVVVGVVVAVGLAGIAMVEQIHRRVVPTLEKLPDDLVARLDHKWLEWETEVQGGGR